MSKSSCSPCCLGLNLYAFSVYSPSFPSGLESTKPALTLGLISLVPFFCLHSADRRVFSARLFNFISFCCLSLVSSSQSSPLLFGPPCDVYRSPESVFFLSLRGVSFSDLVCILFSLLGPVIHRLSLVIFMPCVSVIRSSSWVFIGGSCFLLIQTILILCRRCWRYCECFSLRVHCRPLLCLSSFFLIRIILILSRHFWRYWEYFSGFDCSLSLKRRHSRVTWTAYPAPRLCPGLRPAGSISSERNQIAFPFSPFDTSV